MLNYSIQQNGEFYEISDNNLKMIIAAFSIENDAIDYFQQLLHAENNYIPPTYEELQAIIAAVSRDNQSQQIMQQVPYPQFAPINYGNNNSEPTVSLREVENLISSRSNNYGGNNKKFDDNSLILTKDNFENGGAVVKDFQKKFNNMFDVTMDMTNSPTMELSRREAPYSGIQKLKFNDKDLTYDGINVNIDKSPRLENISDHFVKEDTIVHNFNDKNLFRDEKEEEPKISEGLKKAVSKISDV